MTTRDKHGRLYAKPSDLPGEEWIVLDDGFPCCRAGIRKLENPDSGVYGFRCYGVRNPPRWWEFWRWGDRPEEFHDLDGQLNDDGVYVGVYLTPLW